MTKRVGFFMRHFNERGVEIAVYDYADCNETILGNVSIIYHFPRALIEAHSWGFNAGVFKKFSDRFEMVEVQTFSELNVRCKEAALDCLYMQTAGVHEQTPFVPAVSSARYAIHAVFTTKHHFGDVYSPISDWLNKKDGTHYPVVPYMVRVGTSSANLRRALGIPADAIVFGRYGGLNQFNSVAAQEAVVSVAKKCPHMYFLFMNTAKFCDEMPNVKFLAAEVDMIQKRKFINTCDAFLHGREDGETFGLAVGEFALCGKPIITLKSKVDNAHLDILGDKAIIYTSKETLEDILITFDPAAHDMRENGYMKYRPEEVMERFNWIFLS
jgi:glycosyltransferase involved in cell wall biosynthesis